MSDSSLTVVVPTMNRLPLLRRVLAGLDKQANPELLEVYVVADSRETRDLRPLEDGGSRYRLRVMRSETPGASAARNIGWKAARSPLVLFLGDDILPEPGLLTGHLDWHSRYPGDEVGVLGHVRWADEIEVTPFMRWLEH